jgi:hypothetical protein
MLLAHASAGGRPTRSGTVPNPDFQLRSIKVGARPNETPDLIRLKAYIGLPPQGMKTSRWNKAPCTSNATFSLWTHGVTANGVAPTRYLAAR